MRDNGLTASEGVAGPLRGAIRRARRGSLVLTAVCIGFALLTVILLVVIAPAQPADGLGLARRVPAVVHTVAPAPPSGRSKQRPVWLVTVVWNDADGSGHRGVDEVSSESQPYRSGDIVEAAVVGDHVTLQGQSQNRWGLLLVGLIPVVLAAMGVLQWHRSRAWRDLPTLVEAIGPSPVIVAADSRPRYRQRSRFAPEDVGWLVPVRARSSGSIDAVHFLIDRRRAVQAGSCPVAPGDRLDVWVGGDAAAVCRRSDGAWWVTAAHSAGLDPAMLHAPIPTPLSRRLQLTALGLAIVGAAMVLTGRFIPCGDGTAGRVLVFGGLTFLLAAVAVVWWAGRRARRDAGQGLQ